ncbi:ABC transporter permease [Tautonia sociabilis]|uniref:ABC transporter permease n=2 Tax=Tautonia sociabilis TaxID=2080755 RepID=A0A432MIC1_9BACT|nr:ABC transporter permease [Tautonia sociabilis]
MRVRGTLGWAWTVLGPFVGLVLIVLLFAWLTSDSGAFMTAYNWRTIAVQSVIVGTAALGMTLIMIVGGIDLSVGSMVALVTVAVACLANGFELDPSNLPSALGGDLLRRLIGGPVSVPAVPLPAAMALGVVLGGLCGLLNGGLITRLGVVPFIVTLGTMKVFRGLAKWSAGSTSVYIDEGSKPGWFRGLLATDAGLPEGLDRQLGRLPGPIGEVLREVGRLAPGVWILLVLSVLIATMLRYSLLGRHSYAVGSNEATARLCGLNVPGIKLAVFGIAGLLAGLAGVMQFTYLGGTGDPTTAEGLELQVIAAVVIGGGSLAGGEGKVLGTLIGVLIMSVLNNGSVHAGLPNPTQDIIIGIIIVAAVTLDRLRHRAEG